jgi:KipI family sensor histidine kinase inhibitor
MPDLDIRPVGDAAVLGVLGDAIDLPTVARAWSLAAAINETMKVGILDVVPSYASVLVRFDPFRVDLPRVIAGMRGASERVRKSAAGPKRRLTIRACFGGEHGVDFEQTAMDLGMREARLRDMFCAADYRVAFLGFSAGFPYLVGLPPSLNVARLRSPRPRVPEGSVAIAAGQCGIYPRSTPGGWRLLGRTLARLFDAELSWPALFRPSDAVRFVPVSRIDETRSVDIEALK